MPLPRPLHLFARCRVNYAIHAMLHVKGACYAVIVLECTMPLGIAFWGHPLLALIAKQSGLGFRRSYNTCDAYLMR